MTERNSDSEPTDGGPDEASPVLPEADLPDADLPANLGPIEIFKEARGPAPTESSDSGEPDD